MCEIEEIVLRGEGFVQIKRAGVLIYNRLDVMDQNVQNFTFFRHGPFSHFLTLSLLKAIFFSTDRMLLTITSQIFSFLVRCFFLFFLLSRRSQQ